MALHAQKAGGGAFTGKDGAGGYCSKRENAKHDTTVRGRGVLHGNGREQGKTKDYTGSGYCQLFELCKVRPPGFGDEQIKCGEHGGYDGAAETNGDGIKLAHRYAGGRQGKPENDYTCQAKHQPFEVLRH